MVKNRFLNRIDDIRRLIKNKPESTKDSVLDYNSQRAKFYSKEIDNKINELKKELFSIIIKNYTKENEEIVFEIIKKINNNKLEEIKALVEKIKINEIEGIEKKKLNLKLPRVIHSDIRDDVFSDIAELEKAFNNECYRAATILCGRILETCLHRKYYEVTGFDILEKNPGIGLGKLIAKLAEKNVKFDPGLTQQIHLINQVRIYSVHKKQESFYPSQTQCYAMILYTMDVIVRMF